MEGIYLSSLYLLSYLFEQIPNLFVRSGKILSDDLPDAGRIDAVIGVRDDIAKPTHFIPRKAPVPFLDILRDVRGGLSDNFQGPLDCITELAILQIVVQVAALGKAPGVGHRLVDVGEVLLLTSAHKRKAVEKW